MSRHPRRTQDLLLEPEFVKPVPCIIYTVLMARAARRKQASPAPRAKIVYLSAEAHHALKLLAARRNRPMGVVVAELVDHELADMTNAWTGPGGLTLQQKALAQVWDDPALDAYDDR